MNLPVGGNYHYQWKFNQTNIVNATNSSYTIAAVQSSDAGGYSAFITNASGCALNYSAILSVISPLVNSPDSIVSPTGMVNWWPADGNGNDIFSAVNAMFQNGISFPAGKTGQSFYFDGATGFLKTGASSLSPPWTVCLWVSRKNGQGTSAALFSDDSTNILKLEQYNGMRRVGITVAGVADYIYPYAAKANTWTHLAFVDDGTQIQLYGNGAYVSALTLNFPLPRAYIGVDSFSQPDAIGSNSNRKFTDNLRGSLDEILFSIAR